jgi:hypothetical protein
MRASLRTVWWKTTLVLATMLACSCATEETEMKRDAHTHHAIDYIEIVTTDMEESKRF